MDARALRREPARQTQNQPGGAVAAGESSKESADAEGGGSHRGFRQRTEGSDSSVTGSPGWV